MRRFLSRVRQPIFVASACILVILAIGATINPQLRLAQLPVAATRGGVVPGNHRSRSDVGDIARSH